MVNSKENFGEFKKKIVCCFFVLFFVFFNSSFSFAGFVSVSDGPLTISVMDNFPFSYSFPSGTEYIGGTGYRGTVQQTIPILTGIRLQANQDSHINKLIHFSFSTYLNTAGSGFISSGYPSGATFSHVLNTVSAITNDCYCQVSIVPTNATVYTVNYDCWFICYSNAAVRLDCGVDDAFTCSWTSSSAPSAIAQFSSTSLSYPILNYTYQAYDNTEINILKAMSVYLEDLLYSSDVISGKLDSLLSAVNSVNNILNIVNSQFGVQTNSINNKLDMESQEIQEALNHLESSVVKSLTTINNTLILVNNGITKLDSDMVSWFSRFFTTFIGWDLSANPPVGSVQPGYLIDSMKKTWGEIIEKGLDKVAPDTGALDNSMSNVSSSLDSISNGDLISGITGTSNQENAKTAFDSASGFFSGFGTKILYFNNRLMDIYNSLGDFRYVIIMTMVIGLITFIFRVGNTFMRSRSGSVGKDINLPNKLR